MDPQVVMKCRGCRKQRLESTPHDQRSSCVTTVQLKQTHMRGTENRGGVTGGGRQRESIAIPRSLSSELEFS